MKVAVILSTYNAPDRLEPTLIGYAAQSRRDFELVVADDGSAAETADLIAEVARRFRMPIRHVWQEDRGFRKCRILNQAMLATHADYLIFSDGDCIPRSDFVAVHVERARSKRFLSGGYVRLPAETSCFASEESIRTGRMFNAQWLARHGAGRRVNLRKLRTTGWRADLMNRITPTRATWNGHNASGWRRDLLTVNGFDERMDYGGEDREFGERLVNAGILSLQVRFSAICVHLHHERPYKTDEGHLHNQEIRRRTRIYRLRWTEHGVVKAPAPSETETSHALAADIAVRGHQFA